MAAKGWRGTPKQGGRIAGLDRAEAAGAKMFHAGTALQSGRLVAAGGRVLDVAATGKTVGQARDAAYRAIDAIDFPTGFCRPHIGWRQVGGAGRKR